MIRTTKEDTVITTDDPHIHGGRLPLAKGTTLVVDLVGMRKSGHLPSTENESTRR